MKALIFNQKIIEIRENTYPVAEPLVWVDVTDAEVGDSYINGQVIKPQANTITWDDIRAERDSLLGQTDWAIIKSQETGETIPQNVLDYRQALRDIPQDFATPEEVVFPKL